MRPTKWQHCLRLDDTVHDAYRLLVRGTVGEEEEEANNVGLAIPVIRSNEDMMLLGEVQTSEVIKVVRMYLGRETTAKHLKKMSTQLATQGSTLGQILGPLVGQGEEEEEVQNQWGERQRGGSSYRGVVDAQESSSGGSSGGGSGGGNGGGNGGGSSDRTRASPSLEELNILSTPIPFGVEDGIVSEAFASRTDVVRQYGRGKCLMVETVSMISA